MDKNIPIEKRHLAITNGFGYLTIAIDQKRDSYLKNFYLTGSCMVITMFNEVKHQVLVPQHLIDDCKFPLLPGEFGSLVHWTSIPGSGQLVLTGIFLKNTVFGESSEKKKIKTVKGSEGSVSTSVNVDVNGYQISVEGSKKQPGQIVLTISGKSRTRLLLHGGGLTVLESKRVNVESEQFLISLGEDKSLTLDKEKAEIVFGKQKIQVTEKEIIVQSEKVISVESGETSLSVTDQGIFIESDKKMYIGGDKPVLCSKSVSATEILDLSQIEVSSKVRVS